MTYNVDITDQLHKAGFFLAKVREYPIEEHSRDPEHDICQHLKERDFPDGPVQFWRDGVRTLSHSSIYKMSERRIELGERFPYVRPKRREFIPFVCGVDGDGDE